MSPFGAIDAMTSDGRRHWDNIYRSKDDHDLSWFEASPDPSLAMLDAVGVTTESCIVDIGGGDSRLVDQLIQRGLMCVAVLDISVAAIDRAKTRLRDEAGVPIWIASDVTSDWNLKPMDVWHDRAVFHFLTVPEDRTRYVAHLRQTLKIGGAAIIATFALDGPEKCSGLPVVRYSSESLARELGHEFRFEEGRRHIHYTPWGSPQSFQYSRFTHIAS